MGKSPKWYIPSIRIDYDEVKKLSDGYLYRKGNVLQVWWSVDVFGKPFKVPEKGRETWTFPTIDQAKSSFRNFED
jgi:hypothetical protein